MSTSLSAKKRVRENKQVRLHNREVRSATRTTIKEFEKALAASDKEKATALLKESEKMLDKAATKHALNRKAASRKKSRLAHALNKITA